MKKWIALLLALVVCLSLAACGNQDKTDDGDKTPDTTTPDTTTPDTTTPDTTARTKLVVGFDAEYPPYGFKGEDGEYTGFDLELAQAVCDIYGWELVKQPIDWNSKDMELNSGSIDCIWNGFTMTGREDDYTWSTAYVDNSIMFVVRSDAGITSAADLAGKVVTTQAGSSAYTALTDTEDNAENLELAATFAELQTVADYNTAFMNLESGMVQAIAVDIGVAKYQLEARTDGLFVMLDEPLSTEQYGIGFKKGNTELRDQIQEGLGQLLDNGTFATLAEKYELSDMVCLSK